MVPRKNFCGEPASTPLLMVKPVANKNAARTLAWKPVRTALHQRSTQG